VSVRTGKPVTVVVSDDESMFRASLRQLLAVPPSVIERVYSVDVGAGFQVVGEADSGEETITIVRATRPDLLMLDLAMPRLSGLEALRELTASHDAPRTIVLAAEVEKPQLLTAVQLGVHGLVLKDSTTELLFEAIMNVMSGSNWLAKTLVTDLMEMVAALARESSGGGTVRPFGLTPREREVLALVVVGYGNREIARRCAVSEETIKHHLTRMFDKVGAANRLELAMVASQNGLVDNR
jgi:two-component system nitrate/nitrite response regulator NarL